MRFGLTLLVLLFAAFGAVFGALNSEAVALDFYFRVVHLPKGAAVLGALFAGWLIGGLVVYLGLVLRLRSRVRALTRALERRPTEPVEAAETTADDDHA